MTKSKLEKEIEDRFCKIAERQGCKLVKFEDKSQVGAPDRLILCPNGRALFIEFKKPLEFPRATQRKYLRELKALGFTATWADNLEFALKVLAEELLK